MVTITIPTDQLEEAYRKVKERGVSLSEHGKRMLGGVTAALEKAKAALTPTQETELMDVLATLPSTCKVASVKRGGLIKKHVDIGIRCRDEETEEFKIEVE